MRWDETMNAQQRGRTPTMPTTGAIRSWLLRVRFPHWAHFLVLPLATFDSHTSEGLLAAARGVGIAFAILAFGFLLNSVADRQMDIDASKNPFIVTGAGAQRSSLATLAAVSLVLVAFSPWPAQFATLFCLVLGCVYSIGPRLKRIPIAGTVANVAGFALLLFVGMRNDSWPPRFGYVVCVFAALLLQNQLIHEAAHRIEDSAGGVHTSWLTLGPRWTIPTFALAGLGASVAAACGVAPAGSTTLAVVGGATFAVVFPLLLAWRAVEPSRAARLRVTHRWCAAIFGAAFFIAWRSATP